jgi:dUTP pyrophosphatase
MSNELIKDIWAFHGISIEDEVYKAKENMIQINVKVEKMYPDVELPLYQTIGSAGCDVKAYLDKSKYPDGEVKLEYGKPQLIPTGLKFSVPDGFELQVRPRSGLSLKTQIRVSNSPGTLDSDYRGELMVIMENIMAPISKYNEITTTYYSIKHGERIAQLVFAPVVQAQLEIVDKLDETQRGSGGFGSTGKN